MHSDKLLLRCWLFYLIIEALTEALLWGKQQDKTGTSPQWNYTTIQLEEVKVLTDFKKCCNSCVVSAPHEYAVPTALEQAIVAVFNASFQSKRDPIGILYRYLQVMDSDSIFIKIRLHIMKNPLCALQSTNVRVR
jgi:hypothetical protein